MADYTITVNFSSGSLTVSTASLQIPADTNPTVEWVPGSGTVQIRFIGFYQPTPGSVPSQAGPVSSPVPDSQDPDNWICEIDNTYLHSLTDYFYYTVYAEVNGVTYCTDPEIQNQGPSGG